MWHVRAATSQDVDRLADIHASAYPVARTRAFRIDRFANNALGSMDNLYVVESGGDVVAHGFVHSTHVLIAGTWVACGAIASIGVAPEARGQGVARDLIEKMHDVSQARGDAVTVLYPFRETFYQKHGYGRVSSYKHLVFSPRGVGVAREERKPQTESLVLRAATHADIAAMSAFYVRHARTGHIARTPLMWHARLSDESAYTVILWERGNVRGWLSYVLEQPEPRAATRARVVDFQWDEPVSRTRLFGHLYELRDQVREIAMDVSLDDAIDVVLVDGDRSVEGLREVDHSLGMFAAGPMVRMHALESLAARRYTADGDLALLLADGARVTLSVADGAATLTDRKTENAIALDRVTLARVAFGSIRLSDALAWGLARTSSPRASALASSMFALAPYFSYDPF